MTKRQPGSSVPQQYGTRLVVHSRRLLLVIILLGLVIGSLAYVGGRPVWATLAYWAAASPVAFSLLWDVMRRLRSGMLGVDVIALLAILGALALGEAFAAAVIAVMVAGGTALEEYAESRARHELRALVSRIPRIAHRRRDEELADVPVEDVRVGDLIMVKPGEMVPVDGAVVASAAMLDEIRPHRRARRGAARPWRRRAQRRRERGRGFHAAGCRGRRGEHVCGYRQARAGR